MSGRSAASQAITGSGRPGKGCQPLSCRIRSAVPSRRQAATRSSVRRSSQVIIGWTGSPAASVGMIEPACAASARDTMRCPSTRPATSRQRVQQRLPHLFSVLLHPARLRGQQRIGPAGGRHLPARQVEGDDFGGGRADVDAKDEVGHGQLSSVSDQFVSFQWPTIRHSSFAHSLNSFIASAMLALPWITAARAAVIFVGSAAPQMLRPTAQPTAPACIAP